MYVIFVLAIILIAGLFFLVDRGLKAVQRGRRWRSAAERLDAVARQAEERAQERKAEEEVSSALTSVLPAIIPEKDRGPRKVA
jgi:uncharacterized iron-regulated membrane protein